MKPLTTLTQIPDGSRWSSSKRSRGDEKGDKTATDRCWVGALSGYVPHSSWNKGGACMHAWMILCKSTRIYDHFYSERSRAIDTESDSIFTSLKAVWDGVLLQVLEGSIVGQPSGDCTGSINVFEKQQQVFRCWPEWNLKSIFEAC